MYRLLTFRSKLDINMLFCFLLQYIKPEERTISVCLLLFFITLINLGTQIRGAQTRYTIVSFGLNQPLIIFHNSLKDTHLHCQLCCTEQYLAEKISYVKTGFISTWQVLLVHLHGLSSNWWSLSESNTLH